MDFEKLYIDGAWVPSASDKWIEVENPASRSVIARVPAGNAEDVDRAAKAASAAFPAWRDTPLADRIALMEKFLTEFRAREEDLVRITVEELGSPVGFTRSSQVEYQYTRTRSYIDLAPTVPLVEKMGASTTYREPVGVVGCITPWNYPLGQVIQKIVPALLMGNTVILKPSQHTPLSAYYLTEAIEAAGFPKGVFNLITGRGGEIGNSLSTHPLVNMVSFTGSTKGGVTVAQHALESVKRGPVASEAQFKKISGYIAKGVEEGAKLLIGEVPTEGKGLYIHPTIFTNVKNSMTIAQDEIFGPVLCVLTYRTVDEAVAIANDTRYGLNAGVFGPKDEALAVAHRIEAGNVYVNSSPRDTAAPFGGYKESGIGREGGVYGMIEFTQQKALFDTKL